MKDVHWKRILLIVAPFNILWSTLWFLLPFSGVFGEGLGPAIGIVYVTLYAVIPLAILTSSAIASVFMQENRLKHFFAAIMVSMVVNLVIYGGIIAYDSTKNYQATQQEYIGNPYARPLEDPERPATLIEPVSEKEITGSPLTVVVYAQPGVLIGNSDSFGKVLLRKARVEYQQSEGEILGEGNLQIQRHLSPDGRNVYRATIPFSLPEKQEIASVEVEGFFYLKSSVLLAPKNKPSTKPIWHE
jgi:hypothetical protein